jgi:septum formation protein
MRLILASTSPRRHELLRLLGLSFDVVAPLFVEEIRPHLSADRQAAEFAEGKARSCLHQEPEACIIGSDTLISLDSEVLGKPRNLTEAGTMLRRMAGRMHTIFTAVALVSQASGISEVQVATVQVVMKAFDETDLAAYLRTEESLGKAGAYSIQGAGGVLIDRIEGDYTAAVGLPLRLLANLLHRHGMPCPTDVDHLYQVKPYPNWACFAA